MGKMLFRVASLALLGLTAHATGIQAVGQEIATYKVGVTQRKFVPKGPYNWRGARTQALLSTIWYPAEGSAQEAAQWIGSPSAPFASAGKAAPEAKPAVLPRRFPVIVLSHGTGGSAAMMAWLGTALAAQGYIAVGKH